MQLEDWLDDLCVRFIINLPPEELESVERICFQVEEAQWFYEDFIRPLDPSLPSLTLRAFSLRIFQHCPLFSQWDVQHYTTAFAEFLAYKSRVPVRGAIMLNDALDQVVLVKGWKKGANWSFPRGKINKDEDDLDCAVREVYEETGYDIKDAGLVTDEREVKYIEVNMREQNMRLYVFRGVPMDTHFEPKTRKEISKIEWYKLTDLPTAKKSKHHEAVDDGVATNANKFYMVAPFLVPLKKWIAEQRKRDDRRSSHAHLAPPAIFEETVTEDERDGNHGDERPPLQPVLSYGPSDLPEVSVAPSDGHNPSSQLKQLLQVHDNTPAPPGTTDHSSHAARSDEPQASALLALLREGSTVHPAPLPRAPIDQMALAPKMPRSPHHAHPRPPSLPSTQSPLPFPIRPPTNLAFPSHLQPSQPPYLVPGERGYLGPTQPTGHSSTHGADSTGPHQRQPSAPYRHTGDPQFAREPTDDPHTPSVPPASALPKLTNHTRALLDVFKASAAAHVPSEHRPHPPQLTHNVPSKAGDLGHQPSKVPGLEAVAPSPITPALPKILDANPMGPHLVPTASRHLQSEHQASLLNLFRKPHEAQPDLGASAALVGGAAAPVELSAQRTPGLEEKATTSNELLTHYLPRTTEELPRRHDARKVGRSGKREAPTSATVSGPLNQPAFETIPHPPRKPMVPNDFVRSPIPTARTLFDPNQPPAVKILTRPDESKHTPARSPRAPKATPSAGPKATPRSTESSKSFQPQILRRPQIARLDPSPQLESPELPPKPPLPPTQSPLPPSHGFPTKPLVPPKQHLRPSGSSLPPRPLMQAAPSAEPPISQSTTSLRPDVLDDPHRQSLLSLFSQSSVPSGSAAASPAPVRRESPVLTSYVISPTNDRPAKGVGTMSTRPRMGSTASAVSGTSQAPPEKRQTNAGDRAFLLGYLGRIASQDQ